jgi:hypothetical protein
MKDDKVDALGKSRELFYKAKPIADKHRENIKKGLEMLGLTPIKWLSEDEMKAMWPSKPKEGC